MSGIVEEVIAHLLRGLREVAESQIDNVLTDLKVAMRGESPSTPVRGASSSRPREDVDREGRRAM